jgi:hypothetical protein
MSPLEAFFRDIDKGLRLSSPTPLRLNVIGSSALLLQTDYNRGTKDADVLQVPDLTPSIAKALLRLAGKDTDIHVRHRLYFDVVSSGLPFMPHPPQWHAVSFSAPFLNFEIYALDVVDVVVSKLKRFSSNDREDIEAMINRSLVPHARLIERFNSAVDWQKMGADAERIPTYASNLNKIERDMLGVEETTFDLDDLQY